jgi:succinate dehydrogenase / fumarate reductase, cytochrome b subunit
MHERPLSPHLSIHRFAYTLTSSIANRITGIALSAAFVLFIWWLLAIASGREAYADMHRALSHVAGRMLLAIFIIAFVYHLLAGLRHLTWDLGHAMERRQSRMSAWLIGFLTVVFSAALIWVAFGTAGGAR